MLMTDAFKGFSENINHLTNNLTYNIGLKTNLMFNV
jgi:hypothetical protein